MSDPTHDQQQLLDYLDSFETTLADFTTLVRELDETEWEVPTDLAGWSVHDLVSHTAHLEAVIAGAPEETVQVPEGLPHVNSLMGLYTEQGVIARKERSREDLLSEIETSARRRLAQTRANPPTDGTAKPPRTPGGAPWSWNTMLSNRPLDIWMHEQDIRRATGRPGNLDSAGGRHAVDVFGRGLGFVLGKRAGADPGQTAALELTDTPVRFVVRIGPDGRGAASDEDVPPDTTLRMSAESFIMLSGGRQPTETRHVTIEGDQELGARFLAGLAVTP
jgi:uncharacterized protein (TIGR03083 family)